MYSCSRLNGNTSVCLNPLQKGGDPCEGSVHPDLTAQGGAEAGDSNLPVLAVLVEILQGTARVAVACGGAVLAGDADVPVVHVDGELEGAGGVGDRVHGGVPQHGRDPIRGVTGLAPARDLHVQVIPGAVPLRVRRKADGPNVVVELD